MEKFENALKTYFGCEYVIATSSGEASFYIITEFLKYRYNDYDPSIYMSIFDTYTNYQLLKSSGFNDVNVRDIKYNYPHIDTLIIPYGNVLLFNDFLGVPDTNNLQQFDYRIRNCTDSFGAEYWDGEWYKVGSCKHADICYFDFNSLDLFFGGCITTNNKEIYEFMKKIRDNNEYLQIGEGSCNFNETHLVNMDVDVKFRRDISNIYFDDLVDYGFIKHCEACTQRAAYTYFPIKVGKKFDKSNCYSAKFNLLYTHKERLGISGIFTYADIWSDTTAYLPVYSSMRFSEIENNIKITLDK